jgi:uridine kinase
MVSNVAIGMEPAGSQPRLIVLRGNSASGNSTVAAQIRTQYGRGVAIAGLTDRRRN